jgi:C-terminal processing protease CtpA/Prc
MDALSSSEKPKLLIIDVRHNNGGNLDLLQSLINGIKHFERENEKSKIIVITGRNTFSAAQVFISLLNKDTHALFAGEPSSSSPNFVGEGNYITLPWSGAMGSISNKYHESIPGDTRKWIEPDFPVSLSSDAYFKNQDPVLEFILKKLN